MDTPKPKPDQKVVIENDKSAKWDAWEAQHRPLDPNAKIVDTRKTDEIQYGNYMAALSDLPIVPHLNLFGSIDLMAVVARSRRLYRDSYRLDSILQETEPAEVIVKPNKEVKDD